MACYATGFLKANSTAPIRIRTARFMLAMQTKAGPTAMERARLRHYQSLPSLAFDDTRRPNEFDDQEDVDKTLYGVGF